VNPHSLAHSGTTRICRDEGRVVRPGSERDPSISRSAREIIVAQIGLSDRLRSEYPDCL
jgi:hypothetical protein